MTGQCIGNFFHVPKRVYLKRYSPKKKLQVILPCLETMLSTINQKLKPCPEKSLLQCEMKSLLEGTFLRLQILDWNDGTKPYAKSH